MFLKELKITNSSGDSIQFGRHFHLNGEVDFSGLDTLVNYSESTADGSTYNNTKLENREFDIPFYIYREIPDNWWVEEKRIEAYKVFNPKKNPIRLDFTTEAGESYYINANLEGAPTFITGEENSNDVWQNGLLQFSANDPYIYQKDIKKVDIALWVPNFQFPLEIPQDTGIEIGYRSPSLIVNVLNDGQIETGMLIRFKALGTLTNPSLINVNTQEYLKFKNTTMESGDIIEISTYKRSKYINLERNGFVSSLWNSLDLSSTFLQLEVGDNLFRYDAEQNLDNLEVNIQFRNTLLGV